MAMRQSGKFFASVAALLLICVQPVMAQSGKLKVHVNPREAYIYADGKPVAEARGHSLLSQRESIKSTSTTTVINQNPVTLPSKGIRRPRSMSPCKRFREPFPGRGDASRWKGLIVTPSS